MTVKRGGLMKDMISRNDAYNTLTEYYHHTTEIQHKALREALERVPDSQPELIEREAYIRGFEQGKTQGRLDTLSAQPERLTDDDFETIRIHLNAYKEKLCNQHRWEEANEYQRILDRFMAFASAQPELIRINLNEPIKVKLTDWGKEIYYHQYDRTNQIAGREICKPRFPREDENGYTEFQLWCFIELYGMHMGMTLPNVIEPLEIVYER